jgi:hypothetical protein
MKWCPRKISAAIEECSTIIINIIGEPKKAIPGGGNALVFYNSPQECAISKNSNLGRAILVIS